MTPPSPAAGSSRAAALARRPIVLEKQHVYPHPPEAVWAALTDPRAIAEWMMPNTFRAEVGARFELRCDPIPLPGALTHAECEVLELAPNRRLAYSLIDVSTPRKRAARVVQRITFTLAPEGAGTRLTLRHEGLEQLGWLDRFMQKAGWSGVLTKLLARVVAGVEREAPGGAWVFRPGAIPLAKRCYKAARIPPEFIR